MAYATGKDMKPSGLNMSYLQPRHGAIITGAGLSYPICYVREFLSPEGGKSLPVA